MRHPSLAKSGCPSLMALRVLDASPSAQGSEYERLNAPAGAWCVHFLKLRLADLQCRAP